MCCHGQLGCACRACHGKALLKQNSSSLLGVCCVTETPDSPCCNALQLFQCLGHPFLCLCLGISLAFSSQNKCTRHLHCFQTDCQMGKSLCTLATDSDRPSDCLCHWSMRSLNAVSHLYLDAHNFGWLWLSNSVLPSFKVARILCSTLLSQRQILLMVDDTPIMVSETPNTNSSLCSRVAHGLFYV